MAHRPDKYRNYEEFEANNELGVDFAFSQADRESSAVVVAPHGDNIEPGTSELAVAIAGNEHSLYRFEGLRPPRLAWGLHISSHRFDAPGCRPLIQSAQFAVAIHGERTCLTPVVFLSGLGEELMNEMGGALLGAGFDTRLHLNPKLQGKDEANICNLGTSGAGLQFEISRPLRRRFFASLTRAGRQHRTQLFWEFVFAVRSCL